MQVIYILVATTDRKILQNDFFKYLQTSEYLQLVVSNQIIHEDIALDWDKPFTKIINQKNKGISLNRNSCLHAVEKGVGIIADDDVSYNEDFEQIIRKSFEQNPDFDIFTYKIDTQTEKPYKGYSKNSYELNSNSVLNRQKILKISSIEVAFRIEKIKEKQIWFNTDFGIGSKKMTGGEEVIFLLDCLRAGLRLKYIPEFLVNHPFISSGKQYSNKLLYSFGQVFHRAYGLLYYPFCVYFLLKKLPKLKQEKIPYFSALKTMWFGQ
ncbi:hypothetical protein HNP38_000020 [Chryseobacterium defluvii]|uniref:Glycosyl transferase family 2 n=1 Tax=Chryseobacterium defluvii TaxID=160396 RepID=A0A840K9U2_9FLAO|nr:hypothetical protein [Chryseobacterium defluvii]MBB4804748.1 hypothetical protein [Chryseobacterium defluvii]